MSRCNYSKTAACEVVAEATGHSKGKVMEMATEFELNGTFTVHTGVTRGYATIYANRVELNSAHEDAVGKIMEEWNAGGQVVTAEMVQLYIKETYNIPISLNRVYYYLHEWRYVYRRAVEIVPVDEKWHSSRVAKFIVDYNRALLEEENGVYVIVYTDESYIHSNHARQFGWFKEGKVPTVDRTRRTGRHVIFHAITKDGLLCASRCDADGDLSVQTENAEYIYEVETEKNRKKTSKRQKKAGDTETVATLQDKKDDKESYHGNINSEMWLKWLENKLIPSFRAKYKLKKMILVMDNASYHIGREDDYKSPSEMNKSDLISAFNKYEINSFSVERKNDDNSTITITFSAPFDARGSRSRSHPSPIVDEMKAHLRQHLRSNPHLIPNRTRELLKKEGEWIVLFTPPLEPECQPIELLWGMVKGKVAELYFVGRTLDETREQLLHAFYEAKYRRKGGGEKERGGGGGGRSEATPLPAHDQEVSAVDAAVGESSS